MAAVDFLHHENPLNWAGVEPATLGAEDQQQTNHYIQPRLPVLVKSPITTEISSTNANLCGAADHWYTTLLPSIIANIVRSIPLSKGGGKAKKRSLSDSNGIQTKLIIQKNLKLISKTLRHLK
ncbi:hypothetical protein TNCV_4982651 [Trichonephila clavipes]|uniref:Uncharacterized protein n=1 Tax=Trichonephila clavipes TaxID=2585209 RepID=A0A8X6WGD4_TRICX|nr:hypothetical protein TNCV_4982651 [Trichonephila clavipes]